MKTGLILIFLLLQQGCSSNIGSDMSAGLNAITPTNRPDKHEFNELIEGIVDEMLANNQFVGQQNPIAVASIVNLEDLNSSNRFGYQVSEGIVHYLHENGYRVIDFKLTGNIVVTKNGDFVRSRDWQQLKSQNPVDYIVTGTMDYFGDGMNLSIRMIGAQSKIVVASSQAYIPPELMAAFSSLSPASANQATIDSNASKLAKSENNKNHRVNRVDGQLIRRSSN